MKKKFWRKVRDKIEDFLDVIDDKSPATVEDEDRLVASAPTFLAFIGAPIFLLGIVLVLCQDLVQVKMRNFSPF